MLARYSILFTVFRHNILYLNLTIIANWVGLWMDNPFVWSATVFICSIENYQESVFSLKKQGKKWKKRFVIWVLFKKMHWSNTKYVKMYQKSDSKRILTEKSSKFWFKNTKKSLLVSVKKKWLQIIEPIEFHSKNKSQFHRTLRAIGTITLFFSFLFIKHKVELCHLHDDHSDQTFGMLIPSRWKYWMNHRIS